MKLIVGEYSGFCSGVNYTYLRAKKELEKGSIYCLGEIIHNDFVIKELESFGMITVTSLDDVKKGSKVIFRAHGEPLERYNSAKERDIEVVDLTCPKVKLIHEKVLNANDDSFILIIGKKNHPEIVATSGFAKDFYIIESEKDLDNLEKIVKKSNKNKVLIISQTTFSSSLFDLLVLKIKEVLSKYFIEVDKTICDATEKRQLECENISKKVNTMIVIGGKNSSNTKELYKISKRNCNNVLFAESCDDIKLFEFDKNSVIGIVAGASTPKYLIDEIASYIYSKYSL